VPLTNPYTIRGWILRPPSGSREWVCLGPGVAGATTGLLICDPFGIGLGVATWLVRSTNRLHPLISRGWTPVTTSGTEACKKSVRRLPLVAIRLSTKLLFAAAVLLLTSSCGFAQNLLPIAKSFQFVTTYTGRVFNIHFAGGVPIAKEAVCIIFKGKNGRNIAQAARAELLRRQWTLANKSRYTWTYEARGLEAVMMVTLPTVDLAQTSDNPELAGVTAAFVIVPAPPPTRHGRWHQRRWATALGRLHPL
jgi:hypothetical protein